MIYNPPPPTEAPFNMALATLEALRKVLNDIEKNSQDIFITLEVKQQIKLNLVKDFYISATPLLKNTFIKDNQDKILDLEVKKVIVMQKRSGNTAVNKGMTIIFSDKLEKELNIVLIDVQRSLQDSGYFMPPRKDLGKTVTQF